MLSLACTVVKPATANFSGQSGNCVRRSADHDAISSIVPRCSLSFRSDRLTKKTVTVEAIDKENKDTSSNIQRLNTVDLHSYYYSST